MEHSNRPDTAEQRDRPASTRQKLRAWGESLRPQWLVRRPMDLPKEGIARGAVALCILALAGFIGYLIYRGVGAIFSDYADHVEQTYQPPALPTAFDVRDIEVTEGPDAVATFTVTRTGDLGDSSSVSYLLTGGTAVSGQDFEPTAPAPLVFAPQISSRSIEVPITDDSLPEEDETFFVDLIDSSAAIRDGRGMATIHDNDQPSEPATGTGEPVISTSE